MWPFFSRKILLLIGWWFLFSLLALQLVQHISAQEIIFEDNFSSGNLDKWKPVRDDGTYWQVVDGAAEAFVERGSTITELVPKDEYWSSDWKNVSYTFDFTPLQGFDKNVSFGWEDPWHWFEIHFAGNTMYLTRRENNFVPISISQPFTLYNGITYHMEIKIIDETIQILIDDELILQTAESFNHLGGRIGMKAGTGSITPTHLRYDNIQVKLLKSEQASDDLLPVSLLQQTDPVWANDEYNHASSWSNQPTMSRWGCLVSSIAMVMNYHGISQFNDGTTITPQSLNNWLRSQPDGFVGNGLVVWSAVTRLTRQISDQQNTPKLEYSRQTGDSLQPTLDMISQEIPTILELEGHFVTANGITQDQQDVWIKDPAYTFSKLSQHTKPLLSTRLLTPSFTDLSYLHLFYPDEIEVTIVDENGNQIEVVETFTEQLTAYDHNQTQQITVSQIAKPHSGKFHIQVNSNQQQPFDLTIFAYDNQANLTDLSVENIQVDYPFTLEIDYFKTEDEGKSTIHQVADNCS